MKLKLTTKDESLREILGNGKKYFVPKFQRDYSWKSEQLEVLWEDIESVIESPEDYHYMGYLVLEEIKGGFKIIDGQQRLTTFSLFVLAAIKSLNPSGKDEQERIDELHKSFIGTKNLVTLQETNKLTLNRNNDYYYNEAVIGNALPKRGKKKTVLLMGKALTYFENILKKKTGQEIGAIIETISQNLLFTTIYIGDELNAYKVFETLNARGAQLSSGDLLKNYILSIIDKKGDTPEDVLDKFEEKWAQIGGDIGDNHYTDYILCQWNASHKLVRKTALFKKVREEITSAQEADQYLNTLAQHSQLYAALLNSDDEFWKDHKGYQSIKDDLAFLKLFNIRQPISLLFIAYIKHQEKFSAIVKWIKVFSFRYNVICREDAKYQERLYNDICWLINQEAKLDDVKQKIFTLYPTDEDFKQSFKNKTMPTQQSNKKARYILSRLAEDNSNPIDETRLTVEHILPLSPSDEWQDDFGDHWEIFNQRLGNMAIVTNADNKELDQKNFMDKKAILLKTTHTINHSIQDFNEWSSQTIESRQTQLADKAVQLWRID